MKLVINPAGNRPELGIRMVIKSAISNKSPPISIDEKRAIFWGMNIFLAIWGAIKAIKFIGPTIITEKIEKTIATVRPTK